MSHAASLGRWGQSGSYGSQVKGVAVRAVRRIEGGEERGTLCVCGIDGWMGAGVDLRVARLCDCGLGLLMFEVGLHH